MMRRGSGCSSSAKNAEDGRTSKGRKTGGRAARHGTDMTSVQVARLPLPRYTDRTAPTVYHRYHLCVSSSRLLLIKSLKIYYGRIKIMQ